MDLHFVDIKGFNGKYEISVDKRHIVREKYTHRIIDEWYNGYGDVAVLLDDELYTINELLQLID